MASALGAAGAIIILCNFALFLIRRINRRFYNNKSSRLQQMAGKLRLPHPYIGVAALVLGGIHGWMMAGGLPLDPAALMLILLAAMGITAYAGKKFRLRDWIRLHRAESAFLAVLLVLHYLTTRGFIRF